MLLPHVQRLVTGVFFVLLLVWSVVVRAQDSHPDTGTAYAHAWTQAAAVASCANANACSGTPYSACEPIALSNPQNGWGAKIASSSGNCSISTGAIGGCASMCAENGTHNFPSGSSCSGRPQLNFTAQVSGSELDSGSLGTVCDGGCGMSGTIKEAGGGPYVCLAHGDPPSYWCPQEWVPTGNLCSPLTGQDLPAASAPPGGAYDCTNTQCVNPGDSGGSGPSNPAEQDGIEAPPGPNPVPPGHDNTGGAGPGDGDPTTPTGGTGGQGGQEGGDCNPLSNPDCAYTGGAGVSGTCESMPSCAGDPVQCSILQQTWASACLDNGEVSIPADCDAPMECEGDIVNCASLQLARSQFCALYGDTEWMQGQNVTDDDDFGRDLKTEAESIDLAGQIDMAGFSGGGACPAPLSLAVLGSTVAVSFDALCSLASILRPLIIISSLLTGYMIIGGRR